MKRQKALTIIVYSTGIFVLLYVSVLNSWLYGMSYDFCQSVIPRVPKIADLVIVGIDDSSLTKLDIDGTGLIPHETYDKVIRNIESFNPAVIGVDILFGAGAKSPGYKKLAETLSEYGNIVIGSYFRQTSDYRDQEYLEPFSELGLKGMNWGFTNVFGTEAGSFDQIIRNFKPCQFSSDRIINSLPLGVLKKYFCLDSMKVNGDSILLSNKSGTSKEILFDRRGCCHINYFGSISNFHVIPMSEMVDPSPEQKSLFSRILEGKIVIIGSVNPRQRDIHDIPDLSPNLFRRGRKEYGVIVLANSILSLVHNRIPRRMATELEMPSMLAFNVLGGFAFSAMSPIYGLMVLIASFLTLFYVSGVLYTKNLTLNFLFMVACLFFTYVIANLYNYYREKEERQRFVSTLLKYISPEVAKLISREAFEKTSQGEKKIITVLFSDIRGFTPMSEKMDPMEISRILNQYFNRMVEVIFRNQGTIDKFIGDAIMVIYGAPVDQDDAPLRAVRTAVEMREELQKLKEAWADEGSTTIDVGIGINTGEAFVGTLGSDNHKEYTVLGDTVNLAARLESVAKKGQILISDSTLKSVRKFVTVNELPPVKLKGKSIPQENYEVTGLSN